MTVSESRKGENRWHYPTLSLLKSLSPWGNDRNAIHNLLNCCVFLPYHKERRTRVDNPIHNDSITLDKMFFFAIWSQHSICFWLLTLSMHQRNKATDTVLQHICFKIRFKETWYHEVCSLYGLRFEPYNYSYNGY